MISYNGLFSTIQRTFPLNTRQETYANKRFSSLIRRSEALELSGIASKVGHIKEAVERLDCNVDRYSQENRGCVNKRGD
jgi:hypothetical protein